MKLSDTPGRRPRTFLTARWCKRRHRLHAVGKKPEFRPAADTGEHFFKEHAWGFGARRNGALIRYHVSHPEWDVYPVEEFAAEVDWNLLYGPEWKLMQQKAPSSVVLAAGSAVTVFGRA